MNDVANPMVLAKSLSGAEAKEQVVNLALANQRQSAELEVAQAKNAEMAAFLRANVPAVVNRGARVAISGVGGAMVGAALATFDPLHATVGAAVGATALGMGSLLVESTDWRDGLVALSGGMVAGVSCTETQKLVQKAWANRQAKKAAAAK